MRSSLFFEKYEECIPRFRGLYGTAWLAKRLWSVSRWTSITTATGLQLPEQKWTLSFRQTFPPPCRLCAYATALMTRPLLRLKMDVFGLAHLSTETNNAWASDSPSNPHKSTNSKCSLPTSTKAGQPHSHMVYHSIDSIDSVWWPHRPRIAVPGQNWQCPRWSHEALAWAATRHKRKMLSQAMILLHSLCMCMCMYIYIYMCIYIYVYIYVYIYICVCVWYMQYLYMHVYIFKEMIDHKSWKPMYLYLIHNPVNASNLQSFCVLCAYPLCCRYP